MRLEIAERTDCSSLDVPQLARGLRRAFGRRLKGTLSLALVDNPTIRKLNRKHLGHNWVTDVLSFPLESEDDPDPEGVVGEIVVSVEKAKSESVARNLPLQTEVFRYCVHGCLHLLGYDDTTEADARRMQKEQERIVSMVSGEW